jgi:hypothetical protein
VNKPHPPGGASWNSHDFAALTPKDTERACLGKKAYRSKTFARDMAAKSKKINQIALTVYKCMVCHQFHLTSASRDEKPAIKAAMRNRKNNHRDGEKHV